MALTEAQVQAALENAMPNGGEVWLALVRNGVEISDPGYNRVPFAAWTTFLDGTPANARRRNGAVVTFGPFTGAGEADEIVVIDSASGAGISPARIPLAGLPVVWGNGDDLQAQIDDLSVQLGD